MGQEVPDGGVPGLAGHEDPPCWVEVLVEGWGEAKGQGTYSAGWRARAHRKACSNDPQKVLGGTGEGWEAGVHVVWGSRTDFRTRVGRAPQGDAEEGGREGDQLVHVGPPVLGGPSLPGCGEGAVAWDPSGRGEGGVGRVPETAEDPVGGGGGAWAHPSLAQEAGPD